MTIALDIELTDALREEGIARELINRIQNLRKSSGLEITDRIRIEFVRNDAIAAAVEHYGEYIANQVLATDIRMVDAVEEPVTIEDMNVQLRITKA